MSLSPLFSPFRLTMPSRRLNQSNVKDSNEKTQIPKLSKSKIPTLPSPTLLKRNAGPLVASLCVGTRPGCVEFHRVP